jgi:hypothetical protein
VLRRFFEVDAECIAVAALARLARRGERTLARPFVPNVLLIVATPALDEFQNTNVVTSNSVPGVNIALAVNCSCVVVLNEMT